MNTYFRTKSEDIIDIAKINAVKKSVYIDKVGTKNVITLDNGNFVYISDDDYTTLSKALFNTYSCCGWWPKKWLKEKEKESEDYSEEFY